MIAAQVSGWCQGLAFFELVAGLLVLCVRNQRPPLLEWEADVSEEFSWLQQFFSCLSFECCLSPSLSPLLPFYFSLFAVHAVHIFIFPPFFPTSTHTKPELLLNLCNNLPEKLPKVRSEASLTPFWRKRRGERMRKRALELWQRYFSLITAWDFSVTPDFEVCHVDRIPVWGRRLLSWPPCAQAASDRTPQ